MERRQGAFELRPEARILVDSTSQETGQYLAGQLRKSTGYQLPVVAQTEALATKRNILLTTQGAKSGLGAEGYELGVSPDGVIIRAPAAAGLFYGVQSLLQLFPPEIFAPKPVPMIKWTVPGVEIEDQPRFPWRGLLLDVSRHFFNKAEIKQLLDAMALHKLNTFHWHLVDDQGWRIEIRKYPRLTQVGAWRKSIGFKLDPKASMAYGADGRYGGYYTQADVREIVAYAQARHITIVPEIEMPGHASAALAAYPEFSCSGGPYSTDAGAGVFAGVYCSGKEETFAFLQDVLAEICELFPGKYIHIGGDEVPKQNWRDCPRCQARMRQEGLKTEPELEAYFVRRIGEFLNARGRTLIGWSETREGGLVRNAVLMDWIGGGAEAAGAGHDVVMSPNTHCYFDYYQSRDRAAEPRATAAFLPLEKVYSLEPIPTDLDPQYEAHILGAQGNIWTEYIPSLKQVEYMAFPRLCALAEVVWSPKPSRDWEDFARRLPTHCRRLDRMQINYRRSGG
jgi:hexosaminidase